jgi:hypothetical protein
MEATGTLEDFVDRDEIVKPIFHNARSLAGDYALQQCLAANRSAATARSFSVSLAALTMIFLAILIAVRHSRML